MYFEQFVKRQSLLWYLRATLRKEVEFSFNAQSKQLVSIGSNFFSSYVWTYLPIPTYLPTLPLGFDHAEIGASAHIGHYAVS